ncbi:electron transporter RnfG [Clostridiaceae bacterium 14S0207]|nr:electron transporter RnfG [Clostridiaceae bacterium 14S0207]
MEKQENIFKLGIILLIITACAGLILGVVHEVTADPIKKQEKLNNENAMKEILSKADSFKVKEMKLSQNVLEVNEAAKGSNVIGYAIKMQTKGYGGQIQLMVGISNDGKLSGIKIITQTETPGLGANSTKPSFYGQYKDKPIKEDLAVVKASPSKDNEIQAMSGATITSKAVTSGVNEAIKFYKENLKGGNK